MRGNNPPVFKNPVDEWIRTNLCATAAGRLAVRAFALFIAVFAPVGALLMVIWGDIPWYVGAAVATFSLYKAALAWRIANAGSAQLA